MKKIAVFASGTGTNAENLARVFNEGNQIRVDLLLVDRAGAGALDRLKALGVESVYIPRKEWKADPQKIVDMLKERDIDMIVLAGFLQIVGPELIEAYPDRILNLHPSLLPAYGGQGFWGHNVHEAVIANGEKKSGATVHIVTADIDRGPIVLQKEVDIEPGETPESLETKIHAAEYEIYPRAVVRQFQKLDSTPSGDERHEAESAEFEEKADAGDAAGPLENEKEWAKALHIDFDASRLPSTPPPVPEEEAAKAAANVYVAPAGERRERKSADKMPPTFMLWSILSTIVCCFIPGIVAIIMSAQVSSKYFSGDEEGAIRASHNAEKWIIASIVFGVVSATLYIPFTLL